MDNGASVQDENLVNEQVAAALADSDTTEAPAEPATSAFIPAPTPDATPTAEPAAAAPAPEPAPAPAAEPAAPAPAPEIALAPAIVNNGDNDELITVKQQALEQLSPLISHLDLPPQQKFETYMEIIRASDDKALIQPAFEAAQSIEDEDKKAQALLDVVNEVNYLTQEHAATAA